MTKPDLRWSAISLLPILWLAACGQESEPDANAGDAAASPAAVAETAVTRFDYRGLCEASAAIALDETHFAVASDDSEFLTIYERGKADPLTRVERPGVTDIEGATRIGDTVLWLTSHSLNKSGEDKTKRKVLFATTVGAGATLQVTALEARDLRQRIASRLQLDEEAIKPWLNIEGLASEAGGDLIVGLRGAPNGETGAYLVRLENPLAPKHTVSPQAGASGPPSDDVWRLDLGGRGVRSIERVGEGARSYLILAGPRSDGQGEFALFWWDGASEGVTPGPAIDFGDMTPEALIVWGDDQIQLLGDNEGEGDDRCSESEDDQRPRHFPSISFGV